jgi:hypothetical protein
LDVERRGAGVYLKMHPPDKTSGQAVTVPYADFLAAVRAGTGRVAGAARKPKTCVIRTNPDGLAISIEPKASNADWWMYLSQNELLRELV